MLAVDSTGIYWSEDHAIARLANTSSNVQLLYAASGEPWDLALDDDNVYFDESNYSNSPTPDRILSIPKMGGQPAKVLAGMESRPNSIAVDDTYVYWTDGMGPLCATDPCDTSPTTNPTPPSPGSVRRAPKVGGTVETLASNQVAAAGLVVDDENVYWKTESFRNDAHPLGETSVWKRAKAVANAAPALVMGGLPSPVAFTVDASSIFIVTGPVSASDAGEIVTISKLSGDSTIKVGVPRTSADLARPLLPSAITTSPSGLTWIDAGGILHDTPDGIKIVPVRTDFLVDVIAYNGSIYWTDFGGNRIGRTPD